MRQWVLDAEDILKGSWAQGPEQSAAKKPLTNKEVGLQWDTFLQKFSQEMTKEGMSQMERECLEEFLRVLHNAKTLFDSMLRCGGFSSNQQ